MNQQRAPRAKKRMACTLHHGGKRYSGLVLDLSASGLFVQTSAAPAPGELLEIELPLPDQAEPLRLQGRTARRKVVPPRLRTVAHGGIGVALCGAPEAYFEFVASALRQEAGPPKPAPPKRPRSSLKKRARDIALRRALGGRPPPPPKPTQDAEPEQEKPRRRQCYRVRVKLGPRKQAIEVEAETEEEARRKALSEAGDGWRVLRCEPA